MEDPQWCFCVLTVLSRGLSDKPCSHPSLFPVCLARLVRLSVCLYLSVYPSLLCVFTQLARRSPHERGARSDRSLRQPPADQPPVSSGVAGTEWWGLWVCVFESFFRMGCV